MRKLKQREDVKKMFSAGGKLKVVKLIDGRESMVTIDSLADVTKRDLTEDELIDLGIFQNE